MVQAAGLSHDKRVLELCNIMVHAWNSVSVGLEEEDKQEEGTEGRR